MTGGLVASAHEPYERCGTGVPVHRLSATATPGERVALSFDVTAADAGPLTIRATGEIGEWLDVWIVKVWDQAGVGVYRGPRMAVAELLVKDADEELTDGYTMFCGHLRHLHRLRRRPRYYGPPAIRLTGPATAGVAPGEPVQVWVTATVPAGTAAGLHAGAIAVRGAGGACAEIDVGVTVLPLVLREPRQERFIWYRGTIDCAQPQHRVPENVFRAQLADIRAHGFTAISLNERRPALVRRAARLAREAGFAGTVVLHAPVPAGIAPADLAGLRPVAYVSDEIDVRGEDWHDTHRRNVADAAGRGLPTMTSIADAAFLPRLAELAPVPDVVSVYLPRSRAFVAGGAGDVHYHWAAHMEKPNVHRVLAGFYLWKSGAAGIAPYCYQHLPVHPNSPYDDFDEWEPGFVIGGAADDYKDHLATYPARTGVVPTLQWEGMGEGITDLRYVTTTDELLAAAVAVAGPEAEECVRARATLDELSGSISLTAVDVASETSTEPYPHLTASDLSRFRARLASDALALQAITGAR